LPKGRADLNFGCRSDYVPSKRNREHRVFEFASLLDRLERHGDDTAVIEVRGDDVRTHHYRNIADRVRALALGLVQAGVVPGERVGLMAPNGAPWIIARLCIAMAGAVAVAIDDLADADEAAMIIRSSGLRRLFTVRAHLQMLQDLGDGCGTEPILIDGDGRDEADAPSWSSLHAAQNGVRAPALSGDAPSMLVYTSGTTGRPKAFMLANRNIEVNVAAIGELGLIGPGDRVLLPLPLHHVYPFVVGLLVPLALGATVVLPEAATGPKIVRALDVAQATAMLGVPRLYEALVGGLQAQVEARGRAAARLFAMLLRLSIAVRRRLGLSLGRFLFPAVHRRLGPSLRLLVSAGAKLEPEVIWKLEGLGFATLSGYGLAETASGFTANTFGAQRIGSEGRPLLADGRVRIADPDSRGEGEIQLRGPSVFAGYLDDPDANRAAFTEDGWFRTGDLGRVDEDGYVYVSGRLKEIIVLGGGKKIFPEELEKRYGASPFIREVAVLERHGALVALVVPDAAAIRSSANPSVEAVVRVALASAAQGLPSHERLSGFVVARQPLPRNRLGKYQRFLLPRLYEEALAGRGSRDAKPLSEEDRALLAGPKAGAAWRVLQARYAGRGLSLDADPQLDLGIDSLEWLNLGLELETVLGIRIAEQDFAGVAEVRDLLRLVEAKSAAPDEAVVDRAASLAKDEAIWLAPTSAAERVAFALLHRLNRALAVLFFRLRVNGAEHLPATPPYLIVANHRSDLDPAMLAASLPPAKLRSLYWSGDRGRLFDGPVRRLLCRVLHVFPVDERAPRATLAMAGRALARGKTLAWFPESWRSPDGRLQRFLPGVGRLLAEQSVPVVPTYIDGTFEAMPRDRSWPRPHPVTVTFGPPVDRETLQEAGDGETADIRIADGLHRQVARLAKAAAGGGARLSR
jgi:long-chain acyl-CoA synthetase